MRIFAAIGDWTRLQEYLKLFGEDMSKSDPSWYRGDSFTGWNDSYNFNCAIIDQFLDLRGQLSEAERIALEKFYISLCPSLAGDSNFSPPKDPSVTHQKFYAALNPAEVVYRLSLLDDIDLTNYFALVADDLDRNEDKIISHQREVIEYFFMWAAAFGQAASKGWGLVVVID